MAQPKITKENFINNLLKLENESDPKNKVLQGKTAVEHWNQTRRKHMKSFKSFNKKNGIRNYLMNLEEMNIRYII